jgi:hypothetical protein
VPEGVEVVIYDRGDPDWWIVGWNGQFGVVPATYLEEVRQWNWRLLWSVVRGRRASLDADGTREDRVRHWRTTTHVFLFL